MELLFRSVARAGGIEVAPEVRFFEPAKKTPWEHRLAKKIAGTLPALLAALLSAPLAARWRRLAPQPGHGRTPAHP